jgi:hypothetical protein
MKKAVVQISREYPCWLKEESPAKPGTGCSNCYETFLLATELYQKSLESKPHDRKPFRFRTLALAASLLIVVISMIVLVRNGFIKIPGSSPAIKKESETFLPKQEGVGVHDEIGALKKRSGGKSKKKAMAPEQKKNNFQKKPPAKTGIQGESISPAPGKLKTKETVDRLQPEQPRESIQSIEKAEPKIQEKAPVSKRASTRDKKGESESGSTSMRVVKRYQNGNIQTVNIYLIKGEESRLQEIREFDPQGQNTLIQNLVKNSLIKMGYYPNGTQKFQEEYLKGFPHGTWIKWNKKGEIIEKQIFEKGKLVKTIK